MSTRPTRRRRPTQRLISWGLSAATLPSLWLGLETPDSLHRVFPFLPRHLIARTAAAQEIDFVETFALAPDRNAVLDRLVPGTEPHYYYHALVLQQAGKLDDVPAILSQWESRHGRTQLWQRVFLRQTLLSYPKDHQAALGTLHRELGLTFDHQRTPESSRPDLPISLDPNSITWEAFYNRSIAGTDGLDGLTDPGIEQLLARNADTDSPARRRALLSRLTSPSHPALLDWIINDLAVPEYPDFGSLPIHRQLYLAQLEQLRERDPKIVEQIAFVESYLTKLWPNADVDPQRDHEAMLAYLTRLEEFVVSLPPVYNSLKAHVLYHRLQFDRQQGRHDRDRFLAYLQLPRPVVYMRPEYLRQPELVNFTVDLNGDFSSLTRLPSVGDDEKLVQSYLDHFLVDAEGIDDFSAYVREDYLNRRLAEVKILAGLGDPERWASLLPPAEFQALKERIDLEFTPNHPQRFGPNDPVSLELDVKNVETLLIKIYEIQAKNYYEQEGSEINTDIALDGLVPNHERTVTFDVGPLRRVRRQFDFPELAQPGIYVVDFIGNGRSSRVLVRKGRLHYTVVTSAGGQRLTVFNDADEPVAGANVRLGGRDFVTNEAGETVIPFSTSAGQVPILLSHGRITTLESFQHEAESYSLVAGIHVDRESLLRGRQATVLIRPVLQVNGQQLPIGLLEETLLTLVSTDIDGVTTTKEIRPFELFDDRESEVPVQVPPRLAALSVTLSGKIKSLSEDRKIDLSVSQSVAINEIQRRQSVDSVHLSQAPEGYFLEVLGRTGEARADRPISLAIKHRDFHQPFQVVLKSDMRGRVLLGTLPDIEWLTTTDSDGVATTWPMTQDRVTSFAVHHALEGESIEIPYAGRATEPNRGDFALHERNASTYVVDRFDAISLADGALRLEGLERGDYELHIKETGQRVAIRVTTGKRAGEFVLGASRKLQAPQASGVRIAEFTTEGRVVRVRVAGGTTKTRVHLYATRYAPRFDAFQAFNLVRGSEPYWMTRPDAPNVFQSGRTLGDEYRYILDRRYAKKYPGMMLERPSLLLNPWAVRTTETGQQQAQAGEEFEAGAAPAPASMEALDAARSGVGPTQDDASLDFLAFGSTLVANAIPNEGWVEIELPEGMSKHWLTVVAADDRTTAVRTSITAETPSPHLDLRLAESLSADEAFVQRRQAQALRANESLEMEIGSSRFQTYDSVASAFTLLQTLSNDPTLPSFRFVVDWPKFTPEEKRSKYSEFACHELNVFLYHRDRPFFDEVIRPYLANKRERTFVDRWLLGENLAVYRETWAYAQLNTFERVLLAKRVAEETAEIRRALRHAYELKPLPREEFQRLFEIAVKGFSLDSALVGEQFKMADESLALRDASAGDVAGEMGGMGGGGFGGRGAGAAPGAAAPPPGMPESASRRKAEAQYADGTNGAEFRGARQLNRADRAAAGLEVAEKSREAALAEREQVDMLFRQVDKTQEWAENHWYHVPLESLTPEYIAIDGFWLDYVLHEGENGFLSSRIAEASSGLSEVLLALAIIDLPFESPEHQTTVTEEQVKLQAAGSAIVYHEQIRPALPAEENAPPVLVGQNFFQLNDRYRFEGNEQLDKFVTDEFLVHVVYGGRIAVTNPTSTPRKLDVLLQIPEGAIPVLGSKETRSLPQDLGPYQTITLEYHFYFPAPGDFDHYPVQISMGERKLAAAEPFRFHVVRDATIIDRTSWEWVSQYGSDDEVLAYLEANNPLRLDLSRIAFRMRDAKFFERAIGDLSRRRLFEPTLWSYGLHHDHVPSIREYLQFRDDFVGRVGPALESELLAVDPERRRIYEHLDYRPLVNARAHRLGANRRILNDRFYAQYHRLMEILALRPQLDADDKLAVVYYLLLQDRYEEAIPVFESIARDSVTTVLQYDLFDAWLDLVRERPERSREIASKYVDHPVDRWRDTFRAVVAQLDELESGAVGIIDEDDRTQAQTAAAAATSSFDFVVEAKRIELNYRNLERVTINFYRMDVETLFSRDPFVQRVSGRFSHIRPNESLEIDLNKDETKQSIELPESLRTANVIVEIVGGGETRSQAYYSHALDLQIQEEFGQLQVRHVDGQVLPKTYVKVYARMQDGQIRFYKDGYTDLRGRFDFASLSTNDLDFVERFSILVCHDEHGAAVRETNPPKR